MGTGFSVALKNHGRAGAWGSPSCGHPAHPAGPAQAAALTLLLRGCRLSAPDSPGPGAAPPGMWATATADSPGSPRCPHPAPCHRAPAQSQHRTRLNDISHEGKAGHRGHLEPWLPLLGPPQGGTALATPDRRGRWASGHESDDYELPGRGLVSPRSLSPHGTDAMVVPREEPSPARPAHSLYHMCLGLTGFPVTEKTRGLALGPSTSLNPLQGQALPSTNNTSEDGQGHAGFTAWAGQGGDADITGTRQRGDGLTACLLSRPPPPADSAQQLHTVQAAEGSGWLEAICKQGPGGGRAACRSPAGRPLTGNSQSLWPGLAGCRHCS